MPFRVWMWLTLSLINLLLAAVSILHHSLLGFSANFVVAAAFWFLAWDDMPC